ncbi:MAG: Ald Xan dh C domain-containing protein, partial [Deltaproteobacteria bacterium]|nr:Ald Xan dh C domain-containing protein [Deltaproteobacteria bacterium]
MAEYRALGIPSPRVEGEEKVGGKAVYAVDVVLPDMLWVKVLRSPFADSRDLLDARQRRAHVGAGVEQVRICRHCPGDIDERARPRRSHPDFRKRGGRGGS